MWLFYWFIVTTIDCFHLFFSQEENAKLLRSWTAWLRTKKVHILERLRNVTGLWGFYDRFINRCERRELRLCDPMIKCRYVLAIRFKSLQRDQCHNIVKTPLQSVGAFSLTWPTSMQIWEGVYIRKAFNSHRNGLKHQCGRRFIVLVHQYGRYDVMWKRSILCTRTDDLKSNEK